MLAGTLDYFPLGWKMEGAPSRARSISLMKILEGEARPRGFFR